MPHVSAELGSTGAWSTPIKDINFAGVWNTLEMKAIVTITANS
jgi:hypothetical protein